MLKAVDIFRRALDLAQQEHERRFLEAKMRDLQQKCDRDVAGDNF